MQHLPVYLSIILLAAGLLNDIRWRTQYQPPRQRREFQPSNCQLVASAREEVEVVMFVPSPVPWEDRRALVTRQFLREGWNRSQIVLIYVFGTRTGERLEYEIDTSGVKRVPGVDYLFTACRDQGDQEDNPNGTSATTCKVYQACVHIAKAFNAQYVWRGADDTYVNLQLFYNDMMAFLPRSRLYMGFTRRADTVQNDILLSRHPKLQKLFGLYQYGEYQSGSGYLLSGDVAEFIGTVSIPPHQTWCEDVMVGMWLNPFQIQKIHVPDLPGYTIGGFNDGVDPTKKIVHFHYMQKEMWDRIDDSGVMHF